MGHPPPISYERLRDLAYYEEIERFRHRSQNQRELIETERQEERRREEREEQRVAHESHREQRRAAQQQLEEQAQRWFRTRREGLETQQQRRGQVTSILTYRQQILIQGLDLLNRRAQQDQIQLRQVLRARAADGQQGRPGLARTMTARSELAIFNLHCSRVQVAGDQFQSWQEALDTRRAELAARRNAVRIGEAIRDGRWNGETRAVTEHFNRPDSTRDISFAALSQNQRLDPQPIATMSQIQDLPTYTPNPPRTAPESSQARRSDRRNLLSAEELELLPQPRYIPGERLFPAPNMDESRQPLDNFYRLPSQRTWGTVGQARRGLTDNVEEQVRDAANVPERLRALLHALLGGLDNAVNHRVERRRAEEREEGGQEQEEGSSD